MRISECSFCVSCFCDSPQDWYIFCFAGRSDYFETVGAFKTKAEAETVLQSMQNSGGLVSDYRRIYGG